MNKFQPQSFRLRIREIKLKDTLSVPVLLILTTRWHHIRHAGPGKVDTSFTGTVSLDGRISAAGWDLSVT